MLKNRLWQNL